MTGILRQVCYGIGVKFADSINHSKNTLPPHFRQFRLCIPHIVSLLRTILNGEVIVAYSDILFESVVVSRLLQSKADISIVVNIDWRSYYIGRKDHPIEEAEKVVFNDHYDVVKIGKVLKETNDRCGEFIGMMKLSPRGSQIFKRHFHRARELFWDCPYHQAKTFQKAYITDMIQDMVDLGVHINCVLIEGGSREIDTVEDYEKALKDFTG